MAETFEGTVEVKRTGSNEVTIFLNADTGDLTMGADGLDGDLRLRDGSGNPRIELNGGGNHIIIRNAVGDTIASLGSNGNLLLGGTGSDGDITVKDNANVTRFRVDGENQRLRFYTAEGNQVVSLGDNGNLTLGGTGMDGDIALRTSANLDTINLNGDTGNVTLGQNGQDGDLYVRDGEGNTTIHLSGSNGNLYVGGSGQDGDIILRDAEGNDAIVIDGNNANMFMGGRGRDGDIALFAASENNPANDASKATIHMSGDSGDIILRNADCAEEFTVSSTVPSAPGDAMVLDDDGLLRPCSNAYDTRTIGVISGADLYKPGIVLDRQDDMENRSPIALVGKVCVRVSDKNGPIRIGDMLTTSDLEGHAMKVTDTSRAFGAVIGKALDNHDMGTGMIPMVIALQ